MSVAPSITSERTRVPRSLPTITVFSHPAARLVKTVPQLQPPVRVNGHVPIDTLGVGRTSPTDVVVTDVYGPLSILVVPDPLDPTIATLVLSVGFQNALLQGAARRFVLPFRSFQRDSDTGELISQSKIKGFDAADRTIYPGLGAGLQGLDGGSFWFFEDVGEEGAFDRYRWEKDGVGRRAIWTVWLISTPAPVVLHVQNLLQSYPAPVPQLPPWLRENNGYPWRDTFVASPPSSAPLELVRSVDSVTSTTNDSEPSAFSPAASPPLVATRRPLPTIPQAPTMPKPASLDTTEILDVAALPASANLDNKVEFSKAVQMDAVNTHPQDDLFQDVGKQDTRDTPHNEAQTTPSRLTVRSRHLRDGTSSVTIGNSPAVILRDTPRTISVPEYRNSLVAFDNVTGQIIGVLAFQINLNTPSSEPAEPDVAQTTSDEEPDADLAEEEVHEAQTPLDEHLHVLHDKSSEHALGLDVGAPQLPEKDDFEEDDDKNLATPRQSAFFNRPTSMYCDAATTRVLSRPASILANDTFAPPPLPPKQSILRGARVPVQQVSADAPPSRRTSLASAAFFSAESDAEAMSSYDSDAIEIHARNITHDRLPGSFTSVRGKAAHNDIERHKPELLRDEGEHEGNASDASGAQLEGLL